MTLNELLHKQTLTVPGVGTLLAFGDEVPSTGTSGYATGCLFIHTDGGTNQRLALNCGTVDSCLFDWLHTNEP